MCCGECEGPVNENGEEFLGTQMVESGVGHFGASFTRRDGYSIALIARVFNPEGTTDFSRLTDSAAQALGAKVLDDFTLAVNLAINQPGALEPEEDEAEAEAV